MPRTTQILNFFGKEALLGGLNVTDNPLIVKPQEMVVADNIRINQSISRKKRHGQTRYHTGTFAGTASFPAIASGPSAATAIRGHLQYWRYASGVGDYIEDIFLHQGSRLWLIPNRTDPATDKTGALILSDSAVPSYQVFEGKLFFASTDTADGYNKYDGLDASPGNAVAANPPADGVPKYLRQHFRKMWAAGVPEFPFRLYFSSTADAEVWTSGGGNNGGSLDLDYDGDPGGITAIFPSFQGKLYVATRRTVYEVSGIDATTFVVRAITRGIGCISHASVAATPNDVIFASDRGVHSLRKLATSDQTEVTFLSRDIQPLWTDLLNSALLMRSCASWDETINSYIISVPSSGQTTNDTILVYNIELGIWTVWNSIQARSINTTLINNKNFVTLGREDGEFTFFDPDSRTDLGEGFTARFKTGKLFPFGLLMKQWHFKSLTILCSTTTASNLSVGYTIDSIDGTKSDTKSVPLGNETDVLTQSFTLGQSRLGFGQFLPVTISIDEVGYNFQLDITASGSSEFEFYGWTLEVEDADEHYT